MFFGLSSVMPSASSAILLPFRSVNSSAAPEEEESAGAPNRAVVIQLPSCSS